MVNTDTNDKLGEISVCIPIKNDSQHLNDLLLSISESDISNFDYEILVCDGGSTDDFDLVVEAWRTKLNLSTIVTQNGTASINLNNGINSANFEVFCRIDSHCKVNKDFFTKGITLFKEKSQVACAVGPIIEVGSVRKTFSSEAISKAFCSPFFMGPSKFKATNFFPNPTGFVDTIYLGFYWTADLRKIGGFDERIARKQDIELLGRLKEKTGLKLFQSSSIKMQYLLKQDSVLSILKRAYKQGILATEYLGNVRAQHFIPITFFIFIVFLCIVSPKIFTIAMITYLLASGIFLFIENKKVLAATLMSFLFPACHFSYILGNMKGLINRLKSR